MHLKLDLLLLELQENTNIAPSIFTTAAAMVLQPTQPPLFHHTVRIGLRSLTLPQLSECWDCRRVSPDLDHNSFFTSTGPAPLEE